MIDLEDIRTGNTDEGIINRQTDTDAKKHRYRQTQTDIYKQANTERQKEAD